MSEFSLITEYFSQQKSVSENVLLGIGDDAAIVDVSRQTRLAVSVDTLNAGVHFPENTSPYDIGWKSLAVNLSDMAAMGAKPLYFTLAISMPEENSQWLADFSRGLFAIASQYNVELIGGDTTRGPLSISVHITGELNEQHATLRSAAKIGDLIYVTGMLGEAALALKSLSEKLPLSGEEQRILLEKLNRPTPRVKESLSWSHLVNAAIDISDGLYADLSHILEASKVGANVCVSDLPVSRSYRWCQQNANEYDLALTGGDDYELCLTIAPENENSFLQKADELNCRVTKVGEVCEGKQLTLLKSDGQAYSLQGRSYEHFY
ncbi:MAG: thiamine-phosphate kinase [Gammaproteobacteria bacterium]|nr:thiamine-phosphate kinase [Gammaproteobacteria bacterium]